MLKIAEYNTITGKKVELSELEKYGFHRRTCYMDNNKNEYFKRGYTLNEINVNKDNDNRLIITNNEFIIDETLYDLIKDGYVVKE